MTDEVRIASPSEVRDWARRRGFEVGNRGHMPTDVIDRYNRKHRLSRFENKNPLARGGQS